MKQEVKEAKKFGSKRAEDWGYFASIVYNHIENYAVLQYGDKGQDQCTDYSIEVFRKSIKKYANRLDSNMRPGEELRDLLKMSHYIQMLYDKMVEESEPSVFKDYGKY